MRPPLLCAMMFRVVYKTHLYLTRTLPAEWNREIAAARMADADAGGAPVEEPPSLQLTAYSVDRVLGWVLRMLMGHQLKRKRTSGNESVIQQLAGAMEDQGAGVTASFSFEVQAMDDKAAKRVVAKSFWNSPCCCRPRLIISPMWTR